MAKLLIIDGNNLAYRSYYANSKLSYKMKDTGLIYGFFNQLISISKNYPDHFKIICWDGGYDRRLKESTEAVKLGIVPETYKENRRTREKTEDDESIKIQMAELKVGLDHVKAMQVRVQGYEGDDLCFTYAKQNQLEGGDSVVISSDKDYYQLIDDKIILLDTMKCIEWTKPKFINDFGFAPERWVDVGALEGESSQTGDNIFAVPGWGPKTSQDYIKQYGTVENVIQAVQSKSKKSKKEETLLQYLPRIALAKSLKSMDMVPLAPKPKLTKSYSANELRAYFLTVGFHSLMSNADKLV